MTDFTTDPNDFFIDVWPDRDPQQYLVYDAQLLACKPPERGEALENLPTYFKTQQAAQEYVNDVWRAARRMWPELLTVLPPVLVLPSSHYDLRKGAITLIEEFEIHVADNGFANSRDTIVHEVAHAVAIKLGRQDWHGPKWAGIFLRLMDEYMPGHTLRAAFLGGGVQFTEEVL